MNTKLYSLVLLLLITSCNSEQKNDIDTTETDENSKINSESSVVYDPSGAIWGYVLNRETEIFELKLLRSVDKNTLTVHNLNPNPKRSVLVTL